MSCSFSTVLCDKCKARPATIHLTQIVGDKLTKQDFCEVCGAEFLDPSHKALRQVAVSKSNVWEHKLDGIILRDPRYSKGAYFFVQCGLGRAHLKNFTERGHISGADLLKSLRELAVAEFGAQAKIKLNGWGIYQCQDFGEVAFNLVEAGLLNKSDKDTKADFEGGYDFATAFPS